MFFLNLTHCFPETSHFTLTPPPADLWTAGPPALCLPLSLCVYCVCLWWVLLCLSISFSIVIENFINNEIQFVYFNLLCSSTVVPSGTVHKMVKTGLLTAWTWMKMDVVPVHGGFNLKSKKSVPDECILPASVMSLSTQQTPDTPLSLNCSTPVSLRYPG